jgi:N-acetylneuraminic acid mutarotase
VGLRYAAATPGPIGQILVIGGTTPTGTSRDVYIFNPATGHSRVLAHLRHPITHGGAVTIGSYAYLVGGRSGSTTGQTSAIWSINTATGKIRAAGHLPAPTSDAAVLRIGSAIIVAGGQTPTGTTLAEVGELVPAP